MVARLRGHGYSVLTLDDRVAKLATAPRADPPGIAFAFAPDPRERLSRFDADALDWIACPPADDTAILLRDGEPVRRRRGRAPPTYHLVRGGRGGTELRPFGAQTALLLGYGQAALAGPLRRTVIATAAEEYWLAALALPDAHADVLARVAQITHDGWLVTTPGLPLATAVLARLGVVVVTG